jgi:CRISPR-associated protein Cmr3
MANYQIKLTPVDTYFFGGEKHIEKDGKLESNYFVESNLYPQQTTLLGLLRYYLLLKNTSVFANNRITSRADATKIIGPSSFDYNLPPDNFGKIISVGLLYFQHNSQNYFFAPLDIAFEMENFQLIKEKNGKKTDYNAKDHFLDICQYLVDNKGNKVKLSEIISDIPQVGNEKAEKGASKEEKDNKFYKQNAKKMSPGWNFCFDAEIADGAGIPDKDDVLFVPFGGEKSFFKMEVIKQAPVSFSIPANFKRTKPYILCLSDCFVSADILKQASLSVNRYVSFRNIQSKVEKTEKYSGLSQKDDKQLTRSNRYNLLQRGSIIYFDNEQKRDGVKYLIESNNTKHCITIGFNKIITK